MTDKERIDRLERLVLDLTRALYRQNSALDGDWDHPRSHSEFHRIAATLADEVRPIAATERGSDAAG